MARPQHARRGSGFPFNNSTCYVDENNEEDGLHSRWKKLKELLRNWHFVLCIGLLFMTRWQSRRKNGGVDIITKRWSHATHPCSCNGGVDAEQQHVANQDEKADFSALRRRDTYCRIFTKTGWSGVQATYEDRRTDGVSEKREIPEAQVDREKR